MLYKLCTLALCFYALMLYAMLYALQFALCSALCSMLYALCFPWSALCSMLYTLCSEARKQNPSNKDTDNFVTVGDDP
jgi:hypothetical protein